jgi:hypothetical protein
MMGLDVHLSTRVPSYDNPESTLKGKESPKPQGMLHIEKPTGDRMPHIPKGVYKYFSHNLNVRDT